MTRSLALLAASGLLLAACTGTTTTATGSLSEPVALAIAHVTTPSADDLVFVADATNDDLRAFSVHAQNFIRGPNAISPLSIDVAFRPTRLATGVASGGGSVLSFVVVAGAAPRLALVDPQKVLASPGSPAAQGELLAPVHAQACPGSTTDLSCLPSPAVDVATGAGTAGSSRVFVALAPAATGQPSTLVSFTPTVESVPASGGTPAFDRPILTLDAGFSVALPNQVGGIAARSDGTKVYVADAATPRVVEVDVAGGTTRDLVAAGPVQDVAVSPAFTAGGTTVPEGSVVFAILADGRVQELDPATGAPVPDPFDPTKPAAPLDFPTPARAITFVPCPSGQATCAPQLLTTTSGTAVGVPGLGFVALGDGTAAAIQPDPARPQIYVPVSEPAVVAPTVSATAQTSSNATLNVDPASLTSGVTRPSETFTVTWDGIIPGFENRPATFRPGAAPTLSDVDPSAFVNQDVRPGDIVVLSTSATTGSACRLGKSVPSVTLTVTSVDTTTATLGLAGDTTAALGTCSPLQVLYSLHAGNAFTVVGSHAGYVGRAVPGTAFAVTEPRFFYPLKSAGLDPAATSPQTAIAFTVKGSPVSGDVFTVTTTSGFTPFTVGGAGLSLTQGGFASAVAATPDRLFLTQVGPNSLVQVILNSVNEANGTIAFH